MPCRDDGAAAASEAWARRELDERTAQLCGLLRAMESEGRAIPTNLQEWWQKHQREDRNREAFEALTDAEAIGRRCQDIVKLGGSVSAALQYEADAVFRKAVSLAKAEPQPSRSHFLDRLNEVSRW